MEHSSNTGFKFLIFLIVLNTLLIVYGLTIGVYACRGALDYKDYSYIQAGELYNYVDSIQKNIHCDKLNNKEIKEKIQKIIKPSFYLEIYTSKLGGRTYALFRIIEINKDLSGYDYAYALIHEYIHLTYLYSDESLVDFLSVKLLWESNEPYLQKAACWLIKDKIQHDNGNEYDCTEQLIEYFNI